MNAITVLQRSASASPSSRELSVVVYAGDDPTGADWPSIRRHGTLSMYVFEGCEFLDVWIKTIGQARGAECYFVVVKDGSARPVLYLPLAIETTLGVRLLRFMDAGVADYNAPILRPGRDLTREEFSRLWPEILLRLPKVDVVDLEKIASDVAGQRNPLTYLDCAPYPSSGHSLRLDMLRQTVDARPSIRADRKKINRRHETLREAGQVDFLVNPPAATTSQVVERLLQLKRHKYRRTLARDFLAMPGVERFYREMSHPDRLGRIAHLCGITHDGNVVSAHLGFIGCDRFHYVLSAYDTGYGRFGVGQLLLQHLIDDSFDKGLSTFDLGVGDFPYKERWATHRLALFSYERALTTAGWLYLWLRRTQRWAAALGVGKWFRAGSDMAACSAILKPHPARPSTTALPRVFPATRSRHGH